MRASSQFLTSFIILEKASLFRLVLLQILVAGDEGFEPPNGGTRTHCLTTWRIPSIHSVPTYYITT